MARPPRLVVPDQPLHVIQRGNNRSVSFVAAEDYRYYGEVLCEASARARCAIHAYVMMGNHVHLLLTPADEGGPARMMQALGRRYVRYFNGRYARTGTLWEGRYRSTLVDSHSYFFACSRYIELNPVRARIVEHAAQYPWSSFHHNANGERDPLLTPHALYRGLGARPAERRAAYGALFEEHLGDDALGAIRRATNAGTVLGSAGSQAQTEAELRRRATRLPREGDRRSAAFRAAHSTSDRPMAREACVDEPGA